MSSHSASIAMDTGRRRFRLLVCASMLGLCSRSLVFSQPRLTKVVSHTTLQVHQPWSKAFEASWQVPARALSGSLLRKGGQYIAALEWASQAECETWLGQPGMEETRHSTTQYTVCSSPSHQHELSTAEDDSSSLPSAPEQKVRAREIVDKAFGGGIRSRADLDALNQAPEVDPSVLMAISAGEDVDIDESDEVLVSGGDPSFLNDDKWSSSLRPAEKQKASQTKGYSPVVEEDDDEEDDEEDVLFHGGDPTFLDDKLWGTNADKNVDKNTEEWDGREDDTAHLLD